MSDLTKEKIYEKISQLETEIEEMREKERVLYKMTDEENALLYLLMNKVHAQVEYDEGFHHISQMRWPDGGEFFAFCKYRKDAKLLENVVMSLDSEIRNTMHGEKIGSIHLTVKREDTTP